MTINRNEDRPTYFEKIFAALYFAHLLNGKKQIREIHIKPDRVNGEKRRIEDMTVVFSNGKKHVMQLKYSETANGWSFGDLVFGERALSNLSANSEGSNIYKFLKSWRYHNCSTNCSLYLVSNKPLGDELRVFYADLEKLGSKKITWAVFKKKYQARIELIKKNCIKQPFKNDGELKRFLISFKFLRTDYVESEKELIKVLSILGIQDEDRVYSFITRCTKKFLEDTVVVTSDDVKKLLYLVSTGLIQEIEPPPNYTPRIDLEKQIITTTDKVKATGGFVFLFAPSGAGKTVLLSELTKKYSSIFLPYFCRLRPFDTKKKKGQYNHERLSSKWFKVDLVQRCYELGLIKTNLDLMLNDSFIDQVFEESLTELSKRALETKDKKIVIIVDALDQVTTDKYSAKSVLDAIPRVNYPGIVFLLSTWGSNYIPDSLTNSRHVNELKINLKFTKTDISNYFIKSGILLTSQQIFNIEKRTSGLAISLFYLLNKLKKNPVDQYDVIINSSLISNDVFGWYKPIWDSLNTRQKDYLGYLCFHYAKIDKDILLDIEGKRASPANFLELLKEIDPFVEIKNNSIQPYHDSFRRFILQKLKSVNNEFHTKILNYHISKLNNNYSTRFLIKHLNSLPQRKASYYYQKLFSKDYLNKIFKTNTAENSIKSEIGQSFVRYFCTKNKIQEMMSAAVQTSRLYPTIDDNDIYLKAKIGSIKYLNEIDQELQSYNPQHHNGYEEWVLKRLKIANILRDSTTPEARKMGTMLLEDSLFKIKLNSNIIWHEHQNEVWNSIDEYLEGQVMFGKYNEAIKYLKRRIKFKEKHLSTYGLIANKLANLNLLQWKINRNLVLTRWSSLNSIEKIASFLAIPELYKHFRKEIRQILSNQNLLRYLHGNNQLLSVAECIYEKRIKNKKDLIKKILPKVKMEVPYHRDHYSMWGMHNEKSDFLRILTLTSLVQDAFNLNVYYDDLLKGAFKNKPEEYKNDAFVNVLRLYHILNLKIIESKTKKLNFRNFNQPIQRTFKEFFEKTNLKKDYTDSYEYMKKVAPYKQNIEFFICLWLAAISKVFPNNISSFIKYFSPYLDSDQFKQNPEIYEALLKTLIGTKQSTINATVDKYFSKLYQLRLHEQLTNIAKRDQLQTLASLAATYKNFELAEKSYNKSLKYSHALWSKEDLRVFSLIDSLKFQKDEKDFEEVKEMIKKVSTVAESSWYFYNELVGSASYADFSLGLRYLYEFSVSDKIVLNKAISTIIKAYFSRYPQSNIKEIEPIRKMLILDEEYYNHEYSVEAYEALIKQQTKVDIKNSAYILDEYLVYINTKIYSKDRFAVLNKLLIILKEHPTLKRKVNQQIRQMENAGYKVTEYNQNMPVPEIENKSAKAANIFKSRDFKKTEKILDSLKTSWDLEQSIGAAASNFKAAHLKKLEKYSAKRGLNLYSIPRFVQCQIEKTKRNGRGISKIKNKILNSIGHADYPSYINEMIKEVSKLEFVYKKMFLKQLVKKVLVEYCASEYSFYQTLNHLGDIIDTYCPEVNMALYSPLLKEVNNSIKLSLSAK